MYTITCPQCSQPIQYADQQAGQTANCPRCQVLLQLPFPQTSFPQQVPQQPQPPGLAQYQQPVYPQHPVGGPRKSNSRTVVILCTSIGGGLLLITLIVIILVTVLGGPGFTVPDYFVKATDLSPQEKMLADNPIAKHYFYDAGNKSPSEILAFFEKELPKNGWSKDSRTSYRKGLKQVLNIMVRRRGPNQTRVGIAIVNVRDVI